MTITELKNEVDRLTDGGSYGLTVRESSRTEFDFVLHTAKNDYSIQANSGPRSYLGAMATDRRSGKGNDLPDGRLAWDTWNGIMGGIVWFELATGGHPGGQLHRRKRFRN
jgi:hypothetical protein